MTSIGNGAFSGCSFRGGGCSLELPSTVTTIGSGAFDKLRHLIIPSSTPVSIASDSFGGGTCLYVPTGMMDMYKARTNWNNFAERIYPIGEYPIESVHFIGGTIGQAVDLGLSVKWASWNLGASSPEEYGAYFAWGEIDEKNTYDWDNYEWCNGSSKALIKYNTSIDSGSIDNKTTLDLEDDAAHVNWGGNWRMPTSTEVQELIDNCTSVWTTENGVDGRRFTSNKEGYTDKSIFVPTAGGWWSYSHHSVRSNGDYWSASLYTSNPCMACGFFFFYRLAYVDQDNRYLGFTVRPVCE